LTKEDRPEILLEIFLANLQKSEKSRKQTPRHMLISHLVICDLKIATASDILRRLTLKT
jgi:hypothetical protein